jgi:hypothetical protein
MTFLTIDHHLPKFLQQRLRLDEVARVEAFDKPGVERREQRPRLGALALVA